MAHDDKSDPSDNTWIYIYILIAVVVIIVLACCYLQRLRTKGREIEQAFIIRDENALPVADRYSNIELIDL